MRLDKIIAVRNDKTIYRDGDRCIKVFNEHYSKADVLNEALNIARIEETGLNIPSLIEVCTIDGKWSIVSQYIKGKTLSQLMKENPEKKEEYIRFFIDLQMEVHSKSAPFLNKQKDRLNKKIAETDFDATLRYDLYSRLEEMPKHSKVCHGDFHPANIIITDDAPYIIDWAHATQGNASADVARTYLLFWMRGDISGAELYLDGFCKQTGTEKDYVKHWMPIVAAAQSLRCRDEEREFLMSWVKNNG